MLKKIQYNGKLKEKIENEGRKMAWLAAAIGLDAATLSKILHGRRVPTQEQAEALAKQLNCKPEDIF